MNMGHFFRASRAAPQGMGRTMTPPIHQGFPGACRRPLALRPRQPFPQRGLFAGRYPVLPRDSAAFSPRCDLTPRSHLGRRVRGGPFILGSVTRAGLLNFDTSPKPASNPRRVGAKAFHGSNHRSIHVSEIAQVVSGTTHEYRG